MTGKRGAKDNKRIFLPELNFDLLILCGQTMIPDLLLALTRSNEEHQEQVSQLEAARTQESETAEGMRLVM